MPLWLRKYIFSEIQKFYKDEKQSFENSQNGNKGNKTLVSPDGKVNKPDFTQASKPYKGKTSYK
jgi:hypothetical protein|tara:strand:- start:2147 stop:2338 length:192 start_codon:yes stop_codon:yes gene_type:complete